MSAPGYLRPDELITVQGSIQLVAPTAHAFLAMRDDAAEQDQVNITIATPAGGYRSHAMDVDMHAHPQKYNINPALVGGLYPVGKSKHALGTEVDIAAGLSWVKKNGHKYGFTFTEIAKGDLNHAHHDGITFAGGNSQPITKGALMALSDAEQDEVLTTIRYLKTQSDRIADALFKTTEVGSKTTGGNPMPGGLLRMASINYDATTQREGVNGATRDGTLVALQKIADVVLPKQ